MGATVGTGIEKELFPSTSTASIDPFFDFGTEQNQDFIKKLEALSTANK